MTVLVFGASSQIGHFLLPLLMARGDALLAISRSAQTDAKGLQWRLGHLPDRVPADLPSLSAIICLGPLSHLPAWLEHAPLQGTPRIVAISSMSAQSKRDSEVPAERALSQLIRDTEETLAAVCARRGLDWTVLRPTLVYGAGRDKSLTPLAMRAMRSRLFPVPAASGLRQPVHAQDLARAVLAALDQTAACGRIIPMGGGERLSAQAMFQRVRLSLPRWTLPVPVPGWLLHAAARLVPLRMRGPLHRLQADLIADNTLLEQWLHIHPRPFAPDASCWQANH